MKVAVLELGRKEPEWEGKKIPLSKAFHRKRSNQLASLQSRSNRARLRRLQYKETPEQLLAQDKIGFAEYHDMKTSQYVYGAVYVYDCDDDGSNATFDGVNAVTFTYGQPVASSGRHTARTVRNWLDECCSEKCDLLLF